MAPEGVERKLAAILSADVVGYSRLMAEDEAGTVQRLTAYRDQIATLVREHRGRVVDSPGDNLLAEFPTATDAVSCAVEIQGVLKVRNTPLQADRKMEFHIGIHSGEVRIEGDRIYGDGVNIAARLEGLAEAGGICVSGTAHEQVLHKLELAYEDLGEQEVKNLPEPVRAYRVRFEPAVTVPEVKATAARRAAWGIAIVLVLAAGALAVWGVYLQPSSEAGRVTSMETVALELPDKPSIAVLPFANMSGDPEQEYFSDGISEDLITDLSRISGLFVIARNSSFVYKGRPVTIEQVGRELGVRYVLEGSVRKADDRVRITAQLVDTTTGGHVWAERYDRNLKDIFALQDEVTGKIVDALEVSLTESEKEGVERFSTDNLEAYDLFLRAWADMRRMTKEANHQARVTAQRVAELDPGFGDAYALVAMTYFWEWWNQWTEDPQIIERMFESVQRAIAVDDSNAIPHGVLSTLHLWVSRNHEQAIAEAQKAITLSPNSPAGHVAMAWALTHAGRQEEAARAARTAIRLEPLASGYSEVALCNAERLLGHYDEAISACNKSLTQMPDYITPRLLLAAIYASLGEKDAAKRAVEEIRRISPEFTLEGLKPKLPYKNRSEADHMIAALRNAGVPE